MQCVASQMKLKCCSAGNLFFLDRNIFRIEKLDYGTTTARLLREKVDNIFNLIYATVLPE